MIRYNAIILLIFVFTFLGRPSQVSDAQRSDSFPMPVQIDKKTSTDVKKQDEKKQALFQQALINQDTVTLLISKKSKPKIVRIYKRVPVIIPLTGPTPDYIPVKLDTIKHEMQCNGCDLKVKLDKENNEPLIIEVKKKRPGWVYRLFHKK